MAKNKFSKDNDNNFYGNDKVGEEAKFEHSKSMENDFTPSKSEKVWLVFKQNRKKELHVNRKVYTFWGAGSTVEVDRSVIEHPDFENQSKYFLIKEDNNAS